MPDPPPPEPDEEVEDVLKGAWVRTEKAPHEYRFLYKDEGEERPADYVVQLSDLDSVQREVFDQMNAWFDQNRNHSSSLTIGGFAGTGKSTIIGVFARHIRARVAYCSITGKAANVLKQKLKGQGAWTTYVGTIHSLIYIPEKDKNGDITSFKKKEELDGYDLIIVDEASMLNKEIVDDLLSFDIPVLFVGDHGQLPPVEGSYNLMESPQLRLEHVHRLAEGNPIINLSKYVREYGTFPPHYQENEYITYVQPKQMRERLSHLYASAKSGYEISDIAVLCYSNGKRRMANNLVRELRWGGAEEDSPRVGDTIICLRNALGVLYNGMRARITRSTEVGKYWYWNRAVFDEENIELKAMMFRPQFNRNSTVGRFEDVREMGFFESGWASQLGLLFDYGYALTVHKAQGSSFRNVFLIYERPSVVSADDFRRWAYTAITRSSDKLAIVMR